MPPISPKLGRKLISEILAARHDTLELARQHKIMPGDLAAWVKESSTHETLSALCKLADLQTQVLLSRYRLMAASKLINLAAPPKDDKSPAVEPDVTRRACLDLLKLDLKRAAAGAPREGEDEKAVDGKALRDKLYEEKP